MIRKRNLLASVCRCTPRGTQTLAAVFMWQPHRHGTTFGFVAAITTATAGLVTNLFGVGSLIAIAVASACVSFVATNEYRVLAMTESNLILMRGSRVREVATEVIEVMPLNTTIEHEASTMLTSSWRFASRRYTLAKRHQEAMSFIEACNRNGPAPVATSQAAAGTA